MEIHELLQNAPFQGLKEEDLISILFALPSSLKRYKKGDQIAKQGGKCLALFLLSEGKVRASMTAEDGKEITIEILSAPALLAPAFLFATENYFPVNIEATDDCELFIIEKERFTRIMHDYPLVMQNFLNDISDRSVFLSKKIKEFTLSSLKERLLKYIKINGSIHNQSEVALKLGVTRPSLARALSELTKEGKIPKEY